nr:phage tail protein [Escherichia coli]
MNSHDVTRRLADRKRFYSVKHATNSTSETLAATPKAVKAAYDLLTGNNARSHQARKGLVQLSRPPTARLKRCATQSGKGSI